MKKRYNGKQEIATKKIGAFNLKQKKSILTNQNALLKNCRN
tara:strand:+ start:941 stop:1063 length:123 start_codon:yes stop_codon:yes gene_type:complete